MTDAGLMGKASIDWDHLDTTDSTGELGSLINLARPRGFHVSAAAGEIFEVEEKLTGRCVCHGTAAQVRRWLRENTGEETDNDCGHFRNGGANSNRQYFRQTDDDEGPRARRLRLASFG